MTPQEFFTEASIISFPSSHIRIGIRIHKSRGTTNRDEEKQTRLLPPTNLSLIQKVTGLWQT